MEQVLELFQYSDAHYKIYVHTDQYSICGNDYNSDGKCFSGSDGLDMPYQCPMGENHLYCTVGGYGSGLFRQLRTYDKSEEFLFKMENIPESKKVAVINPQKRIKDKKRQAAAICAVPVLFV